MSAEDDFIKKLMVSKAIMDKHKQMPRAGDGARVFNTPMVETYDAPAVSYNLPQEFIQETSTPQPQQQKGPMTEDRIMSSKLPDEIKRLMIEHPIAQPNGVGGPTLSNDLIDKAARLMNTDPSGKQIGNPVQRQPQRQNVSESVLDNGSLRAMLKEVVKEVLSENGILSESTQKTNETFSFKVGKHLFEGNVTKIKKLK
jgi:hypothetical protein